MSPLDFLAETATTPQNTTDISTEDSRISTFAISAASSSQFLTTTATTAYSTSIPAFSIEPSPSSHFIQTGIDALALARSGLSATPTLYNTPSLSKITPSSMPVQPKRILKPQELPNPYSHPKSHSALSNSHSAPYMVSDDVRRSTLISAFFMHIWPEFPLFNQEQFLASDMAKSEILILAMLCNAAKFIDPPNEDPNSDPKLLVSRCNAGDRYFNKAVSQFGGAIMVTPSYENILAFYYLCYAAVRFAQLIGLDNERQNPESYKWSQEERELRRRIWWTLYEVDRYFYFWQNVHAHCQFVAIKYAFPVPR
ncbi:hypothetical protein BSLG_001534 [Batrachochytrium salamandrivorans]|nr:hypothetical protein BSLG_001534 [Batrachochytrium salamandrivorans]